MAVDFDGTDDELRVTASASLDLTTSFSIGAWIDPDGYGNNNEGRILEKAYSTVGWALYLSIANHNLRFLAYGSGESVYSAAESLDGLPPMHVAVVVDAAASAQIYINGIASGEPGTVTISAPTGQTFRIGSRYAYREFDGRIGDVWYYGAELSSSDLVEIATRKRLPMRFFNPSILKLYLPLMGPTGAAVATTAWGCKDLSGNGNHVASVIDDPVWADDPLAPQSWVDGPFGGAWVVSGIVTKTLTDVVSVAEGTMGLLHLMSLADAVVVLDSNLLRHNISLTDVLQAGDTQTLMHLLSLADVVALADVVSHQHQMGLTDQVAAAETRGLQHEMTLTDAVGTAEAQAKQHAMALVEAVALQDSRALKHLMALQDAVSVTTTVTHQQVTPGEMTITDVAVIADGVELMHILSLGDSVWLRQVARIASCGDGSYFERPDGDCRRGYEDDDGQDANLYQELV